MTRKSRAEYAPDAESPRAGGRIKIGSLVVASPVSVDMGVREILEAARSRRRMRVHFCTMHTLAEAEADDSLHAGLARADLIFPDGMPVAWLVRLMGGGQAARVCGPDVMPLVIERGRADCFTHYLVGGAPGVAERLRSIFEARMPGCRIVGTASPSFGEVSDAEEAALLMSINAARPDFVWVGLGTPRQDHWLIRNRQSVQAGVMLAVGAAFDFHAGTRRRAPAWLGRIGLEWLYRLMSEPRRLWRRYTIQALPALRLIVRALRESPSHG